MKKIVLKIDGMTCSACSSGLEKYLSKQSGIISVNVNLVLAIATIEYEGLSIAQLEQYIEEAGFESLGEFKDIEDQEKNMYQKRNLLLLGILLIFMMYLSMGHMLHLPELPYFNHQHPILLSSVLLLFTLLFIGYGWDLLKSGFKNLIHRMPNMDTLVLFSVFFSFIYSFYYYIEILKGNSNGLHHLYFESICMVIYFIKLGRYIETISKDKTKEAIRTLVQVTPKQAIIKRGENEEKVSIDEVHVNDLLICRAGDKIAVDGIVVNGKTYVDESFITGESEPVLKEKGSKVIAGSISYDGYIEYQAKKIGKESTISEIVTLVVEATNQKSRIQRLADRISGYFVPFIMLLAFLTFIIQLLLGMSLETSLTHMVTILVVACPCALGLAVPLVVVVSNGKCAQKGLFIRNGDVLEKARTIDTIVFDKTGTLTFGKLNIFKVFNYSEEETNTLINKVANIEKHSSHPISTAFQISNKLEVSQVKVLNGMGISGVIDGKEYFLGNEKILKKLSIPSTHSEDVKALTQNGCSMVYVVENNKIIGLIGVKDVVRESLKPVVQTFKQQGIEVAMLTGDHEETAKIIAKELGITKVIANVLPKKKAQYIQEFINEGKKVMMVGDGINDAPALVTATIGVSINDGTDVAMDSADVILMNNDMNNLLDLIIISHQSYKVIKQNLFWAFFYNLCMLPIAMGLLEVIGIYMNPMIGSIAMTFSSLTVVLNSLRFGRWKNETSSV